MQTNKSVSAVLSHGKSNSGWKLAHEADQTKGSKNQRKGRNSPMSRHQFNNSINTMSFHYRNGPPRRPILVFLLKLEAESICHSCFNNEHKFPVLRNGKITH